MHGRPVYNLLPGIICAPRQLHTLYDPGYRHHQRITLFPQPAVVGRRLVVFGPSKVVGGGPQTLVANAPNGPVTLSRGAQVC